MATSCPSTPLGALSEEEVVIWSEQQPLQACVYYNLVLLAPLANGVVLHAFFPHHLCTVRAACISTA